MAEKLGIFLGIVLAQIIKIAGPDIIKMIREFNRNTFEDTNPNKELTDRLNNEIKKNS